jgi:hypothetical protein
MLGYAPIVRRVPSRPIGGANPTYSDPRLLVV